MWRRRSSELTESSAGLSSAGMAAAVAAAGAGVVAAVLFGGAVVVHAPAQAVRAASAEATKKRLFIVRVASLEKRSVCFRTLRRARFEVKRAGEERRSGAFDLIQNGLPTSVSTRRGW